MQRIGRHLVSSNICVGPAASSNALQNQLCLQYRGASSTTSSSWEGASLLAATSAFGETDAPTHLKTNRSVRDQGRQRSSYSGSDRNTDLRRKSPNVSSAARRQSVDPLAGIYTTTPTPRVSHKPMPVYKRLFEHQSRKESAKFVKREQYTRIYEFLHGLRKSSTASQNWQVSVTALKDAAERGTPITSDLIAEAIEACYVAKQYQTANDLFYRFHFDYNVERGAKAVLAFLRVCAATGQYEAAKRVVEWVGDGFQSSTNRDSPIALLANTEEADISAKRNRTRKSATNGPSPSATHSLNLTAELLTLFLRAATAVTDNNLFLYQYYPDALQTYSRLRCSARNAPTVVTNPLLVEAIVLLHCRANAWEKAYELLLKTVRLLSIDSGKSSQNELQSNSLSSTKTSEKLRKLLQIGDEDEIAASAAKDINNGQQAISRLHDELRSDGSFNGSPKDISSLDDVLGKMGLKSPFGRDTDLESKASEEDKAASRLISLNEKGSLDNLLQGNNRDGNLSGGNDDNEDPSLTTEERLMRNEAKAHLGTNLVKAANALRSYSEIDRPNGSSSNSSSDIINSTTSMMNTVYNGPLPSNITYITEATFDAVIKACFAAKKHVWVFKTAYLAIALGPAASSGYAPDEAAARMLIFSIEEVTAQIYQCIGGNHPSLQMKAEYLKFCAKERERIRSLLIKKKRETFANEKTKMLSVSSFSATKEAASSPTEFKVSDTELLMALPDEIVFSAADLDSRLNAWKFSLQLFRGLAEKGFPLFPQTYESPFRTFIAAGRPEEASKMIDEMKKDDRQVPSYCYQRLLCEQIAHEPSTRRASQLMNSLEVIANLRDSPSFLNAMLRHSIVADHPKLFRDTSKKMQSLQVTEDREKLLLTIRHRLDSKNIIGALAAFSRLYNTLGLEGKRTQKESNFSIYQSDFFIPQPLLKRLLAMADEYISDQETRKEKVEMTERGLESPATAASPQQIVGPRTTGSSLRFAEYWNDERQRNLDTAKVIRKTLVERIGSGLEGQFLGLDAPPKISEPSKSATNQLGTGKSLHR